MLGLAWRLLGRELRSGELRLLFSALVIAVAAVTTVAFFAERVQRGLQQEAGQLMGGDLVLSADHALPEAYRQSARDHALQMAETLVFPSMVMASDHAQLADIKAVSPNYPLRGTLAASDTLGQPGSPREGGPAPGSVWVDERLAAALALAPGMDVNVGSRSLRVGAILTREPDRGVNFFSLAPRLLMHLEDIPSTGLVQFGARIRYTLLLTGNRRELDDFRAGLVPRLQRGERLEDPSSGRPEIRNALERSERFLGLATLLTVVLTAVAVALAARRYMQRHFDACAVLRCLGMTQGRLLALHGVSFLCLALGAWLAGCVTGFAAHFALLRWLGALLDVNLPMPGLQALVIGAAVAGVLLFGFAFPPLLQLARVPTLRVLRRELGPPPGVLIAGRLLGMLLLVMLIVGVAGSVKLGAMVVGGFSAAIVVFWGAAQLLIRLLSRLRGLSGFGWRQGLANLSRHRSSVALQVVALAVGIMALLLLTVIRGELIDSWQKSVPDNAPNRFVINIQPDQRDGVRQMLKQAGIDTELQPMVRARLLRIAGKVTGPENYPEDERAQRLIEREFNLSWRAGLPEGNRIVAGQWFGPDAAGDGQASVEEGLAKTLGIHLGDELVFSIAGNEQKLKVTSLRKLDWDSMRVNFFVLTPPGVIDAAPASDITSFHLPEERRAAADDLVRRFPNLTLIDVGAILQQLQSVITQVAAAVQFVFVFTLLAGAVVLYAAIQTVFDERRYELSIMRALGAARGQLAQALRLELAMIGGLAGFLAAVGAIGVGIGVGRQVFQLDVAPIWWLPLASSLGGAALSSLVGWLSIRRLLAVPPILALRAGA